MRKTLTAIAIFLLIVLSSVSNICVGDPDTLSVNASENTVDIKKAARHVFTSAGSCQITLHGSWSHEEIVEHPHTYVVYWYRHSNDVPGMSGILFVGEVYDWSVGGESSLYLYFPDPGDVSDNHGNITVGFFYGFGRPPDQIVVPANEHSVSLADAEPYNFLSGGNYKLEVSGDWHYYQTNDYPQDYVLAYYLGTESERSEKLDDGTTHVWNVSSEDVAYFYMPDPGATSDNHGVISVKISAIQDQGPGIWWLEPMWIGIWLTLISITIGIIGLRARKKRG